MEGTVPYQAGENIPFFGLTFFFGGFYFFLDCFLNLLDFVCHVFGMFLEHSGFFGMFWNFLDVFGMFCHFSECFVFFFRMLY